MRWIAFVIAILAVSPFAFADTVDFREPAFAAGNFESSFTITVTYPQTGRTYDLTIDAAPDGARLWWDPVDGFGVRYSYENDEIEGPERLTLRFSKPLAIHTIYIADLFQEGGRTETGWYQLNGGPKIPFEAIPGALNGERAVGVGVSGIQEIIFSAPGAGHEFAVQGIDATPNPEPGTLVLIGSAAASTWYVRRRRRRRAAA